MLNNIKLRECIAVNLLENSFFQTLANATVFFSFCAFVLSICFCVFLSCMCYILCRRRRSLVGNRVLTVWPTFLDTLHFVINFACMPFNAKSIFDSSCGLCGSNSFLFQFIPFDSYFCARSSSMTFDIHLFGEIKCIQFQHSTFGKWRVNASLS